MAIEPRWCLVVAANVDIRLLQKCKRLSVHVSTPLPCKMGPTCMGSVAF